MNFACKRAVRIRIQRLILLVILVQTIMKFRLAHQVVQDDPPDFPVILTSTQSINENRNTTTKIELRQGQTRLVMHNELNAFVSENGNSLAVPNKAFTSKEWSARLMRRDKDFKTTRAPKKIPVAKIKGRKVRVIYGIMTYDSDTERRRRGLIRRTFLKYFHDHMNRTIVSDQEYNEKKHWICSLNDLDRGVLNEPEKCRMAYVFVQGANPNGPSMLLTFNDTYPLSLQPPPAETEKDLKDQKDTIYLNIQENGKFGKTPTWFRYAIDVLERHGWMNDFDYIFKSDTDNLLYTPYFFRYMDNELPMKVNQLVYGGLPLDYKKCGGDKHDHCKDMIGPYFMQGGIYFLSTELARFISDETAFDHQAVKLPHEDMTTGNFVYSHPEKENIKLKKIKQRGETIRYHPLKTDKKFKFRWNLMLKREQCRLTNCDAHRGRRRWGRIRFEGWGACISKTITFWLF